MKRIISIEKFFRIPRQTNFEKLVLVNIDMETEKSVCGVEMRDC